MILSSARQTPIKSLSGYRRGHRIPDRHSEAAEQFIATAAHEQLREHLEHMFRTVRDALGYRRRELSAAGPAEGVITLDTPDFRYHHSVFQSPADASRAIWRRELLLKVSQRADGSAGEAFSARLDVAFADAFDTIELAAPGPVDVAQVIDRIEARPPRGITCEDYPSDAAWCDIRLEGLDAAVHLTREGLFLRFRGPLLPSRLIQSLGDVGRALGMDHAGRALP